MAEQQQEFSPGDPVTIRATVVRVEANGNVVVITDPVYPPGCGIGEAGYQQTITLHHASMMQRAEEEGSD